MRHIIELKNGWQFTNLDGQTSEVSIPHTWNAIDGQDGGDDYKRGTALTRWRFKSLNSTRTRRKCGLNLTA